MFIVLLLGTLIVAVLLCVFVEKLFRSPISKILQRLVGEEIYAAWTRYMTFAIYVVGISGGVRIWEMEKYIPATGTDNRVELTPIRLALEFYNTLFGTLQSLAWMLLVFFLIALIAYVIVKGLEMRRK